VTSAAVGCHLGNVQYPEEDYVSKYPPVEIIHMTFPRVYVLESVSVVRNGTSSTDEDDQFLDDKSVHPGFEGFHRVIIVVVGNNVMQTVNLPVSPGVIFQKWMPSLIGD
jgi:hypothetical protein